MMESFLSVLDLIKNNTMVAMTQHASLYSFEFEGISHSGSAYMGKSISVTKSET